MSLFRNKIRLTYIFVGICLVALFLYGSYSIKQSVIAEKLCDSIENGETIHDDVKNRPTAPRFLSFLNLFDPNFDAVRVPLVQACYCKNVQAVSALLENGADPNYFVWFSWTPLEAVFLSPASEETYQIVELLMKNGADPQLHLGHIKPVIYDISTRIWYGNDDPWLSASALLLLDYGGTNTSVWADELLYSAAHGSNEALVTTLLNCYNANVNMRGLEGKTPITAVVDRYDGNCDVAMVELLLAFGADPYLTDEYGQSAYTYAVEKNRQEVIALIEKNSRYA